MCLTTFIFVEKIGRFVVTELVKLSDEFDIVRTMAIRVVELSNGGYKISKIFA